MYRVKSFSTCDNNVSTEERAKLSWTPSKTDEDLYKSVCGCCWMSLLYL